MDIKEKRFKWDMENGGATNLLRIGVLFLAVVSYFTTANGMKEYIFVDNGAIAYAASAAIQGILLALSMSLPSYLQGIWNRPGKDYKDKPKWIQWGIGAGQFLVKLILWLCVIALTLITLFCSSWFSYVYIANIIHQDSWGIDSELLVQQVYRTELYNARDYAHIYRIYLEERIGEKILLIEEQTKTSNNLTGMTENEWEIEREKYASENGTTASNYMSVVIDAMENALKEGSTQESRDLAVTAVADAKENITNRMESIQENLNTLDGNITNYNNQIVNLTNRINRATEGTDTSSLANSINSYTQLINDTTQRQAALQTEYIQLDNAFQRLPFYESQLGLSNSTSAISIRNELMRLQSEFFKQEPDVKEMLEIATQIFDDLRNASNIFAVDENEEALEENLSYTNLLVQMNQLLRSLSDYSEIKNIELDLQGLITELREVDEISEAEMQEGATSPSELKESNVSEEKVDDTGDNQWKIEWRRRLATLKAQISAMPIYSEDEKVRDGQVNALTESQANILYTYNRSESSKSLDDITRRYISNHSAIYDGIIYLQSPYRSLALFALLLALSYDLSGFIFGFVVLANAKQEEYDLTVGGHEQKEWSILETLKPYIVLTGDYESRDGCYYYKTFKDGVLYYWAVNDKNAYMQGIYIQEEIDNVWSKGIQIPEQEQELTFSHQTDGPLDGIYRECQLFFDEGGLILIQNEKRIFLTSVDEYVPIHIYDPSQGENRTIPAKQLAIKNLIVKVAVVALNGKGTMVVAVYVIGNL